MGEFIGTVADAGVVVIGVIWLYRIARGEKLHMEWQPRHISGDGRKESQA